MRTWIDLPAVLQILGVGLLTGAGLPVLFAAGLKALTPGPGGTGAQAPERTTRWYRIAVAVTCFGIVLAVVAAGLLFLTTQS